MTIAERTAARKMAVPVDESQLKEKTAGSGRGRGHDGRHAEDQAVDAAGSGSSGAEMPSRKRLDLGNAPDEDEERAG